MPSRICICGHPLSREHKWGHCLHDGCGCREVRIITNKPIKSRTALRPIYRKGRGRPLYYETADKRFRARLIGKGLWQLLDRGVVTVEVSRLNGARAVVREILSKETSNA